MTAARKPVRSRGAGEEAAPVVTSALKLSKDELRAQVAKLERANGTLRAKARESGKSAKLAAARIAELEDRPAELERDAARLSAPAAPDPRPEAGRRTRVGRRGHGVDPGDAVPPGVAVEAPAALDEEARTALGNLEEHLGSG